MEQAQSALGIGALVLAAWALGGARRDAPWRFALAGFGVAFALAAVTVLLPGAVSALEAIGGAVRALQAASDVAASFVFGHIGGGPAPYEVANPGAGLSIAFQILPVVVVTAAIAALLDHWGVLSRAIAGIGWALRRSIGVDGPLGFAAGASFFLGVAEAPLFLRRTFARLSAADLFAVMVLGLSTVSGVVFVLYATVLADAAPNVAAHILAASLISLPTALAVARLAAPPEPSASLPATPDASAEADPKDSAPRYVNWVDALTQGGLDGMRLFLNIIAVLLVVIATVALLDSILGVIGDVWEAPLTVRRIFGWLFAPVAFAVGAPWEEAATAGALFGAKAVLNEFVAYLDLAALPAEALSARTRLLLIYALCGFGNLAAVGILLGVVATLAPSRRAEVARFALRAWIAGNLTTALTGAMIGVLTPA